jgi:hypothetical protein
LVTVALVGTFAGVLPAATAATARANNRWDNCTAYNKVYPHGVGRNHARDNTTGTPVTTFKHSTKLYNMAMAHNGGLDRDKDGIACERR